MNKTLLITSILGALTLSANATAQNNQLKFGYAHVSFGQTDDNLVGPMTPPGITAEIDAADVFVFSYQRFLNPSWSVQVSLGIPPTVTLRGAGTGSELGEVGSAEAHTPAIMMLYHYPVANNIELYAGAGINHAKFKNPEVTDNYNHAFFGSSSKATIDDSTGGAYKLGMQYSISKEWAVDLSVSYYQVNTEANIVTTTPGFGDITRSIKTTVDPTIAALTLAYSF